jgi:uncharacterized protein YkwD
LKKNRGLLIALMLFQVCMYGQPDISYGADSVQANEMYIYLQSLRQKKVPHSDPMYNYMKGKDKLPLLVWNDTLAVVAMARARDMAKHNYFNHIDNLGKGVNYYISEAGYNLPANWLEDPENNYFESIQAGASSGIEAVRYLIIDKGEPTKGHRKHLLGQDEWNVKNIDFGAAFYRVPPGTKTDFYTYTVIIIARHRY